MKSSSRQFTYPLVLLSNFPDIPDSEQLGNLEMSFWALSKKFVFLRAISMSGTFRELTPPYLRLSQACLATCLSPSSEISPKVSERSSSVRADAGKALFLAGLKVWGLMLEVDNREARKVEAVMAVSDTCCCVELRLFFAAGLLYSKWEGGQVG
jgi:hypothetical protein